MRVQDDVRKKVKLSKALNNDIYYKDFADYLEISEHSFYNWLNGYYNLSANKLRMLDDIVTELAMDESC